MDLIKKKGGHVRDSHQTEAFSEKELNSDAFILQIPYNRAKEHLHEEKRRKQNATECCPQR